MMPDHTVTIDIPGHPVPKGRPRFTKSGRAYTDPKTRAYEAQVSVLARLAMAGRVFTGPVRVSIVATFARPQRLCRKADPAGCVEHDVRPDLDNVVKAVLDGLAPCWGDDAQVWVLHAMKVYARIGGAPGVRVTVSGNA
jgi:Holliday junction resolvase RusA-like endonuclease